MNMLSLVRKQHFVLDEICFKSAHKCNSTSAMLLSPNRRFRQFTQATQVHKRRLPAHSISRRLRSQRQNTVTSISTSPKWFNRNFSSTVANTQTTTQQQVTTQTLQSHMVDSSNAWWTLSAQDYTAPSIFEAERRKLLSKVWTPIGPTSILSDPGSYISTVVGGYPIFVIRGRDGQLRGFHNVCRHRAHPIVSYDQSGKCDILRCRYHGWVYDISGQLKRTPSIEMTKELQNQLGLIPVRVQIWNNLVFVNLDHKSESLETWLGNLGGVMEQFQLEDYVYHSALKYELDCNWKVYVDNYQEGYHIPTAHPMLNSYIEAKKYKVTNNGDGAPTGGLWVYFFPTWAINCYSYGMDVELIIPLSYNKTRLELYYFYNSKQSREAAEENMRKLKETSDIVVREDIDLCHAVQRNLEAGVYNRGVLSNEMENGVYGFQQEYRRWMMLPDSSNV